MTIEQSTPVDGEPGTASTPALSVRGLTAGYGRRTVIHDIDLTVGRGEIVVLLGRNGAGKSTTLMAIAGFLRGVEGEVTVGGRPLSGTPYERARTATSLVLKGRSLFPSLTVRDNLRLADVDTAEVLELFPQLEARVGTRAGALSGGEQQLVAVGRALLRPNPVVLLDELTFGLSPAMASRLIEVVTREVAARGLAVLAVEQHIHIAQRLADRALILGEGRVRLALRRDELTRRSDEIENVYLGRPALDTDRPALDTDRPATPETPHETPHQPTHQTPYRKGSTS